MGYYSASKWLYWHISYNVGPVVFKHESVLSKAIILRVTAKASQKKLMEYDCSEALGSKTETDRKKPS